MWPPVPPVVIMTVAVMAHPARRRRAQSISPLHGGSDRGDAKRRRESGRAKRVRRAHNARSASRPFAETREKGARSSHVGGFIRVASEQTPVLIIHAQQDRDRHAIRDDAAAAERQQRQRQSLRRQHAHVDADVDERLHADPHADAMRAQRRERARQTRGLPADRVRAIEQPDEQREHDQQRRRSQAPRR